MALIAKCLSEAINSGVSSVHVYMLYISISLGYMYWLHGTRYTFVRGTHTHTYTHRKFHHIGNRYYVTVYRVEMLSKVIEGFASWLMTILNKTVNTQSGL